jgi:GT2 family glycosyltransferase
VNAPATPSVSVVVITYARPEHLQECLEHLGKLSTSPHEVIVVDGSPDDRTRRVVAEGFPDVRLVPHRLGPGTMPESRALGLAVATGDVVAFIDDDAYVDPTWLDELVTPYADPTVHGVGGRALNGIEGEESDGLGQIGRFLPNGMLTGGFGADPGRLVEVHHLLGANMSFRRSALEAIGGIRGSYPGTCLCEESDISLRVRAAGGRLVYQPRALVRHVAAPYQTGGQRFDRRYLYYARRNHLVLLVRNLGWRAPVVRHFTVTVLRSQRHYLRKGAQRLRRGQVVGAAAICSRAVCELVGLVAGVPAAARARAQDRRDGVATPWGRS